MLPNTLPLLSGSFDPIPLVPTSVRVLEGEAFRISDDGQRSVYRLVSGGGVRHEVTVQHSVQNGKLPAVAVDRHTIRYAKTKVDADSGVEDTSSASLTIAASRRGFENDELIGLVNGLLNILMGAVDTDILQVGHTGTWPNEITNQLLSGVI